MGRGWMALGILAIAGVVGLRLLGLSAAQTDLFETLFELGMIGLVVYFTLMTRAEEREKQKRRDGRDDDDDHDDFIVG